MLVSTEGRLWQIAVLGGFLAMLIWATPHSMADPEPGEHTIRLSGARHDVDRLAADATWSWSVFESVDADVGDEISIGIRTSSDGIETWIVGPDQEEITPENIEGTYGGSYWEFEGGDSKGGPGILLTDEPGFQHWYVFPSLGPGTYTVHYEVSPAPVEDIVVIIDLHTCSSLRAKLFSSQRVVPVGFPAGLAAAVFEGESAVLGATVSVDITPPTLPDFQLTLLDNGEDADFAVGDGLYGGLFWTEELGDHVAVATITGSRSGGTPFCRQSATQIRVVAAGAGLTQTVVDYGEDDDGNGLFERLVIEVQDAEVTVEGTYSSACRTREVTG